MDNAKICCLEDFMMEYTLWNMCFIKFLPKLEKSNKTIYIYIDIFSFVMKRNLKYTHILLYSVS